MRKIPPALVGIAFLSFSLTLFLSLISYNTGDISLISFPPSGKIHNIIGIVGAYLGFGLLFILGYSSFFIPLYLFLAGLDRLEAITLRGVARGRLVTFFSFLLLTVCISAFAGIFPVISEDIYRVSGFVGIYLSSFLKKYLGFWGSGIFLLLMIFTLSWMLAGCFIIDALRALYGGISAAAQALQGYFKNRGTPVTAAKPKPKARIFAKKNDLPPQMSGRAKPEIRVYTPKVTPSVAAKFVRPAPQKKESLLEEESAKKPYDPNNFHLPSLDLLKVPPAPDASRETEDIETCIKNLEETLADFGVGAKVTSVQKGPVVTMYELEPDSGVKIQQITTLSDDIALAMKSSGVRIVAPIPGRGTVGVEIPNITKHLVFLREVLEEKAFTSFKSKLALAIGKDVKGDPVVADLNEMPHLLIAGTTGSGKTVCVNSLISSMLFKAKPNEVKFILVDPKKVELAPYKGIPHLLHPIISDAKKACSALNWAVEEMENRYKKLAEEGARNIDAYNKREFRMPYIVIIIDELADLMIVARDKIETSIQRLAQLSRAVGIHLILATQRPSVDVITGVIKANFPARISFKVSSKVDSRTVLDVMGAEKLIGKGDCLFVKPGLVKTIRAQSSFIDDEDLENLTGFLKSQGGPVYEEGILEAQKKTETTLEKDEMLDEAIKVILSARQASASLLQRRLRVGYTRAARLLDLMEEQGIVGPFIGSKAREILVDPNAYLSENKL